MNEPSRPSGDGPTPPDSPEAAERARLAFAAECQEWLGAQCATIDGADSAVLLLSTTGERFEAVAAWPGPDDVDPVLVTAARRGVEHGEPVVLSSDDLGLEDDAPAETDASGPREEAGESSEDDRDYQRVVFPFGWQGLAGVLALRCTHPISDTSGMFDRFRWEVQELFRPYLTPVEEGSGAKSGTASQSTVAGPPAEAPVDSPAAPPADANPNAPTAQEVASLLVRQKAVVSVSQLVATTKGFREGALAITTDLAQRLDCDRVSIGRVVRGGVQVEAVSNTPTSQKTALVRAIAEAMDEAATQGAPVTVVEGQAQADGAIHQRHLELARVSGARSIYSLPLQIDDHTTFVLTFEHATASPFAAGTLEVLDVVGRIAGPLLELKRRDDRNVLSKVGAAFTDGARRFVGPGLLLRSLIWGAIIGVVLAATFVDGTHRISADTIIEGETVTVVTAPIATAVQEVFVQDGDRVKAGDRLARFDTTVLEGELKARQSELAGLDAVRKAAEKLGDLTERGRARAQVRALTAKVALLQSQLDRAYVVAPTDGIVLAGDVHPLQGSVPPVGQKIFSIAQGTRVILEVEDTHYSRLGVDQPARFVLNANPGEEYSCVVERVGRFAQTRDGMSVCRVRAKLDEPITLRPGSRGIGKIDVGREKLGKIWTGSAIDWARRQLWKWLP